MRCTLTLAPILRPLIEMMSEVCGSYPPLSEQHHIQVTKFFGPIRVETNYLPDDSSKNKENKGTKRQVRTVIFASYGENATNVTFPKTDANGKVTHPTVQQHFLEEHNIRLHYPRAPLANAGIPKDPIWIPAELCKILPGQLKRGLLTSEQTARMITFAARRPHANAESITGNGLTVTMINPVVNGENTNLKGFGVKVDPRMVTVPGRILMPPTVMYKGLKNRTPNNGTWNLKVSELGLSPFRVVKKLGEW